MELSPKEYREYFQSGNIFSAIPYIIEAITEITSDVFGMKAYEKGRYWYGEWEGHKRKVISIWAPKGTTRMLFWGWNYDYIPHRASGDKIKYARTEKSFSLDVGDHYMYHLYDYGRENIPEDIYFRNLRKYEFPGNSNNAEIAREYMRDVFMSNLPFIKEFFENVKTDEECMELLDKRLEIPSDFSIRTEAYIKAFILAKNGRLEEAENIIMQRYYGHYANGWRDEKIFAKLKELAENKDN